jgi:hypothetical protein
MVQTLPWHAGSSLRRAEVHSFLAFSGTKVQILTQMEQETSEKVLVVDSADVCRRMLTYTGTKVQILTQKEQDISEDVRAFDSADVCRRMLTVAYVGIRRFFWYKSRKTDAAGATGHW